jgi:hypothetical protein
VQSLNNKKLNIDVLLTDEALELDILCITEHWLEEKEIYQNPVGKISSMEAHVSMSKQI